MTTRIWEAQARSDEGKGASRRLRHAGLVPAIIYGADKAPASVTLNHNFLVHAFEDDAVFNSPITVKGLADEEVVVIKAVQRHPAKPQILHVDLQRLDNARMIYKRIPLNFMGADIAPGVKAGGVMTFFQVDVEVRCLPANLPSVIDVDVSKMDENTRIRLSDLALPEGVQATALLHGNSDYDQAVVGLGKSKKR
jgi:large subunit ribosomal protein L25